MENRKYQVHMLRSAKETHEFRAEFQRINIILGGNGTGKSKLLNRFKGYPNQFGGSRSLVYVEGGRTIHLPDSLKSDHGGFAQYHTFHDVESTYNGKRSGNLSNRVRDALFLLDQKQQKINIEYAQFASEWALGEQNSKLPAKQQAPLNRLFEIFNEVFPSITLTFNDDQKKLSCIKDNIEYTPTQLSDGEKQVLSLLADIFMLAEPKSLILVDEPELNLNPGLACRFWDILENELPEAVFIYATHCVSFAMRNNVDKIIVLGKNANTLTTIGDISELDPIHLRDLLGAIPAILSSSAALAIEGKENSFDQVFYRWLIKNSDLEVIPIGGCTDVYNVANKKGIWEKIAPAVKIGGVIDSDYRSDQELKNFNQKGTIVLAYHEVESYFCDPKLIHEIGKKLSTVEPLPTEDDLTQFIFDAFLSQINSIAAQRTFARANIRLGVSVERRVLSGITNEEDLRKIISQEAVKETQKATDAIGEQKVLEILTEELERCKRAHNSSNMNEVLLLMPGKELLNKLANKIGCRTDRNLANSVRAHIKIEDYPALLLLRDNIKNLIE